MCLVPFSECKSTAGFRNDQAFAAFFSKKINKVAVLRGEGGRNGVIGGAIDNYREL